jgi:lipoprotein-releasing system permease protein
MNFRPFVLFLALRHIRRRALQSALTVLGVAVGVMVLVTALSLTNGFIDELISSTLQATPHVSLYPAGGGTLPDDGTLLEVIEAHPEVVAAAPYVSAQALIARRADAQAGIPGRQGYTQVLGIDPERQRSVLDLGILSEKRSALEAGGIILGSSLANSLGVWTGDEVLLVDFNRSRTAFSVAGTFRVGNEIIDAAVSYTSLAALQGYLGARGELSGFHVRLADPDRALAVAQTLADATGLLATPWQHLFGNLVEQLELQKTLISVVVFLIVLVAAMGIANILILTVAEKTEEIALLRAVGASQQQILAVFTTEGLLLGGVGTLLGALLGLGLSLYFKFQPYPLPGDLYFITQLPVALQAWDFVWVCTLSLVTSVVAGLLPARRAGRLDPAEILR